MNLTLSLLVLACIIGMAALLPAVVHAQENVLRQEHPFPQMVRP